MRKYENRKEEGEEIGERKSGRSQDQNIVFLANLSCLEFISSSMMMIIGCMNIYIHMRIDGSVFEGVSMRKTSEIIPPMLNGQKGTRNTFF